VVDVPLSLPMEGSTRLCSRMGVGAAEAGVGTGRTVVGGSPPRAGVPLTRLRSGAEGVATEAAAGIARTAVRGSPPRAGVPLTWLCSGSGPGMTEAALAPLSSCFPMLSLSSVSLSVSLLLSLSPCWSLVLSLIALSCSSSSAFSIGSLQPYRLYFYIKTGVWPTIHDQCIWDKPHQPKKQ